ncbi:MAG: subtype I-B CRISPR-associated endonuclease Cas1 [Thermotogae bacterium]|nr:MAG: subtype I-B CRISPR-associated endonuclease Cas1 [Thermotogota bacterium]RLG30183.1 MAG: subtype I-B CRISPR-associated endonuclease Cas1 [Methanosarcinales archaeon]
MKETIYVFSNGELKRQANTLYFEGDKGRRYIPVENVSGLMIFGEVTINKKLMEFISRNEILLHFFNYYGYYVGTYYPREHYNSGYMILKQAEHYIDEVRRLRLAFKFVEGASANILRVLKYYKARDSELEASIKEIEGLQARIAMQKGVEELMAIEGNIRNRYYSAFNEIIKSDEFSFDKRTKRPPTTKLDALISFGNSLLYVAVLSEIYKTHLDPRIGFLHTTNFRRFTLNLDVAEVFKPIIVDRAIFSMLNRGMLREGHFMKELERIYLNEKGREIFVREFEDKLKATIKHEKLKRNVSYRRLIRMELYKIEKHLMGESEYKPFVARW